MDLFLLGYRKWLFLIGLLSVLVIDAIIILFFYLFVLVNQDNEMTKISAQERALKHTVQALYSIRT
jgi:Tfp pilus assembly protein PilO